jgi:hypothetical protein
MSGAVEEFNECCVQWEKLHKTGFSSLSSLVSLRGATSTALPMVGSMNLDLGQVNAEECLGALKELLETFVQLLGVMEALCRKLRQSGDCENNCCSLFNACVLHSVPFKSRCSDCSW